MVYGYWEKAMGYEVLDLVLQPLLPKFIRHKVRTTNPNVTGKRPRLRGKLPENSPIMLNYVVRKPVAKAVRKGGIYQTDYSQKWAAET